MVAQKLHYSQLSFRFIRLTILNKPKGGKILVLTDGPPPSPKPLKDQPIPWTQGGRCHIIGRD